MLFRLLPVLVLLFAGLSSSRADIWSTFAGAPNPSGHSDGPAATAKIWRPAGITRDAAGNLFFIEDDHANVVRKINPAGVVSTFAGNFGSRSPFWAYSQVAADSTGNIYLAGYAQSVLKITPAGVISTFAGSVSGYRDGTAANALFSGASGITVDPSGNVYLIDQGQTVIRKITPSGMVSTLAGMAGAGGTADGTGATARFNRTSGLACDAGGNIYAADDNAVRKITPAGVVTTLAGSPSNTGNLDGTGASARFYLLAGIWVDNTGNIFVIDGANSRIRKITADGVVTSIAGSATRQSGYLNGTGTAALFANPSGITGDNAGNLYVTEPTNHTVRKIVISTGAVTTVVGTGAVGSNDGTGTAARFNGPQGMAFDSSRNLYVADRTNFVIRKITPGGAVTLVAGSIGVRAHVDGNLGTSRLDYPSYIATDKTNTVYFTENGSYLRKLSADGTVTTVAGSYPSGFVNGTGAAAKFGNAQGLATDSAGNIFIADSSNYAIRKVTPSGNVTTFAGGTNGTLDGTGTQAQFRGPRDIVADATDNLYVLDVAYDGIIRKITPGGVVTTIGNQTLYGGESLRLDGKGGFYATEAGHNMIRKVSMTGIITTLAGNVNHPGSAEAPVQFSSPVGLAVDPDGRVFVSDSTNHNIRMGIITDGPPSLLSQPGGVSVVAGASASFSVNAVGSDPLTYQWRRDGANIAGATSATYTIATTKTADAGAYSVVVTNALGTVTSSSATLTVYPAGSAAPSITQQPKSLQYPLGSKATFSVTATGTPAPAYQWRKGGTPITGGTASSYTINVVKAADADVYDVVVSNALGSATSTGATLTIPAVGVNVPPNVVVQPNGPTVSIGASVSLSVGATGSAPLSYQWRKGGVAIVGATASRYTIPAVALTDAGSFDVLVSNPYGKTASNAVTLTVNAPPASAPVITTQPADVASYAGATATFAVVATGVPSPTYQWRKGGVAISGATGATYRIANVQAADAGAYSVTVSNAQGNVTSNSAALSLKTIVSQNGNWYKVTGNPGGPGYVDGQGKNARFYNPSDITIDPQGNLYVADRGNQLIRKITPSGLVTTLAGQYGHNGHRDGLGTLAAFNYPISVACDKDGNLSVVGSFEPQLRKITPAGMVSSLDLKLNYARGVAVDLNGNTFTVDYTPPGQYNQGVIQKVTSSGGITNLAGSTTLNSNADGIGAAACFRFPSRMACDAAGNLYVTDASQKIRKVSPSGLVSTLQHRSLAGPSGLVLDSNNNFYVADSTANSIVKVAADLSVTTIAGGSYGYADGTGTNASFWNPSGITRDPAGNLFVADTGNNTIRKITTAGVVTTLAGYTENDLKDGNLASARIKNLPDSPSLFLDSQKNLYFCDAHAIRKVSPDGLVTTIAGSTNSGKTDGPGASATFNNPLGLAKDSSGNLYVADSYNQTIRKISPSGVVSTFAGISGSRGIQNGLATSAKFDAPRDLVVDSLDNVYVMDVYNHVIRKITPAGVVSTFSGSGVPDAPMDGPANVAQFRSMQSMAIDRGNSLYVCDTEIYPPDNRYSTLRLRKIAPDGSVTSLSTPASTHLDFPKGIAIDAQGSIYIAFPGEVYRRDPDGTFKRIAGGGLGVTDSETSANVRIFNARGLAIDPDGILYITEGDSNKIRACTLADVPVKITAQPASTAANRGAPVVLSVATTGTGPVSFQWRFNGVEIPGAIGSTLTIPAAQASDAGSYDVVAANGANFVVSSAATLTVNNSVTAPLVITAQPADVTTYRNSFLSLNVTATGPGPLTYQWRKDGLNLPGANAASYNVLQAQPTDSGIYEVDVLNPFGAVTSRTVTVNVSSLVSTAITITSQPVNVSVPLGGTATFNISATRSSELTDPLTYQWRKNGVEIRNATAASLQISQVSGADIGSYDVLIFCGGFSVLSNAVTLNTGSPVTLVQGPKDLMINAGASADLTVSVTGSAPISYQWLKNGVVLRGATSATLSFKNIAAADAAVYSVSVTNPYGGLSTYPSATISLVLPPTITAQPQSLILKNNASGTMSVTASGTGPFYYQWRKDGVPLWGATKSYYTIASASAASAGMYECVVSNMLQSVTSQGAFVQVASPIQITRQPVGASVTAGSTLSLSVQAKGADILYYQWYKTTADGRSNPVGNQQNLVFKKVTAADAGKYFAIVTGNGTMLFTESATVQVSTGRGITVLAQPQNFSAVGGKVTLVPVTVAPNGLEMLETRYRLYTVENGVATATSTEGLVEDDGKVQVPVRPLMAQSEQAWLVRFTRTYQDGTKVTADSQRFYGSVISWDLASGTYEGLLQDSSVAGAYGDGARYRGMITLTVTNSGAVSGQLRFTEAPVVEGAANSVRAYLPVVRAFSDSFVASPTDGKQWNCTPSLGVGAIGGRQELSLNLDFSKSPVVLTAVVKDNASANPGFPGESRASTTRCATTLPTDYAPLLGNYILSTDLTSASPAADNNAYTLVQVLPSGRVNWSSRLTGYSGSGTALLNMSNPVHLTASLWEAKLESAAGRLSGRSLMGSLTLDYTWNQKWQLSFTGAPLSSALEYQYSEVSGTANGGVLRPMQQDGNMTGIRRLDMSNQSGMRWGADVFKALAPEASTLRLTSADPLLGASSSYSWDVNISGNGTLRIVPASPLGEAPPALTLRLDSARGEWTGSYTVGSVLRTLNGVFTPVDGIRAAGWLEAGTQSTRWQMRP